MQLDITSGKKVAKLYMLAKIHVSSKKKYLLQTKEFYEKYGGITIVLARFMPFARTFAPVVAGIGMMKYKNFAFYNFTGGILWVTSMTWLGYLLGATVPAVAKNLELTIILIIFISILPGIIKYLQVRKK